MAGTLDSTNALIGLAQVAAAIGSPSVDNDFVNDLINAASWCANTMCDRKLKARDLTEYYDGDGDVVLLLQQRPVVSVTALYQDAGRTFGADTEIDSGDYELYSERGKIVLTGTVFIVGPRVIKITYNAGYAIVPHDLENAVLELVAYWYDHYKSKRVGIKSIAREGRSVTYRDDIPGHVKDVFWDYKKIVVL